MNNSRPPRTIYREPKPKVKKKFYERLGFEKEEDCYDAYGRKHKPIVVGDYSGFPSSIFWTIRLVLIMALVLGFPMLIFFFSESIEGYIRVVILFSINEVICRYFGWHKLD